MQTEKQGKLENRMPSRKIKTPSIPRSEITPEEIYKNRRSFLKTMGLVSAGALLAACAPQLGGDSEPQQRQPVSDQPSSTTLPGDDQVSTGGTTDELGDPLNSYEQITNYNNFYEFTVDKEGVASMSADFQSSPWQVEVYGLCNNPQTFTMDDFKSLFTQEERIYRLRCVEAWSMVIPWTGFELNQLLEKVEPTSEAKYVRFETLMDPEQFPGQKSGFYPWPYQEGLTIDEAMHPLVILATGLYGKDLPSQNGAPLRLVVPWKYGFKSIKSIVKIELVSEIPATMWSTIAPQEYGFYANVNPEVSHPRWSQASERRIGELSRRPTLMFNGYEADVAYLYEGLDLKANY
jgi:sulfoxide reductase catalytic subunit YedY